MRRQIQLLVNHGDAAAAGVQRIRGGKRTAIEFDLPGVGNVSAAQNFHERAFAGAVFADERVNFARADFKGNILERARGAEALLDPGHSQAGRTHSIKN